MQCDQAEDGDIDGYAHESSFIATIVTPRDCAQCHEAETAEFEASHHANAGRILGSLDNVLAEVVEGFTRFDADGNKTEVSPAAVSGCLQCHDSEIKVLEDGRLDRTRRKGISKGRISSPCMQEKPDAIERKHAGLHGEIEPVAQPTGRRTRTRVPPLSARVAEISPPCSRITWRAVKSPHFEAPTRPSLDLKPSWNSSPSSWPDSPSP